MSTCTCGCTPCTTACAPEPKLGKGKGKGTGLSNLPVNAAGPAPNKASKTHACQLDNKVYSSEVIYNDSNQDDWDEKVMAGEDRRRGMKP